MSKLSGKVAAIVDERELVINRGEEHGVSIGMRFAVLADRGAEVRDPDTGEVLGDVPIEKTTVKVVRVEPKLSVARTFRTVGGSAPLVVNPVANLFAGTRPRPEELRYADQGLRDAMVDEDLLVRVGDRVVETSGAEYGD